jgi:hypothetical protein
MNENTSLISAGFSIVRRHKRYIFWFWLLNLTLAEFGVAAYRNHVHAVLDHSFYADKLLHGFDAAVYLDLMARPEIGPFMASAMPAVYFACLFLVLTIIFMPGVLQAYTTEGRLPREEFFRACGRNLWRFIRLMLFFAIVAVPIAGVLFGVHHALVDAAEKSTNELLPFYTIVGTLAVIFLVMTFIRIWFDLAQLDVVVNDQNAVRKSVAAGFRYAWRYLGRLLVAYVAIAIVASLVLLAGIGLWHVLVPAASVFGAFLVSQITLVLLLWMRFWQRASAAAFYLREIFVAAPVWTPPAPVVEAPAIPPPITPPIPEGTGA